MSIEELIIRVNDGAVIGGALTIIAVSIFYQVFLKDNEIIIKKRDSKRQSA
jgi:hypothetical protein